MTGPFFILKERAAETSPRCLVLGPRRVQREALLPELSDPEPRALEAQAVMLLLVEEPLALPLGLPLVRLLGLRFGISRGHNSPHRLEVT